MALLSDSIKIGRRTAKNRIVVPPLQTFGWGTEDGLWNERHFNHYKALAHGGAGLIILEATAIDFHARNHPLQTGIWGDEHIPMLERIFAEGKDGGALMLLQLQHPGFNTTPVFGDPVLAPSDFEMRGKKARAMTKDEIREARVNFLKAAVRVKKAGGDGVELHGAHGYLLDSFANPVSNTRDDMYGGGIEGRARLAAEIIYDIRATCGDDFIITCRMGANCPDIDGGIELARFLEKAGCDFIDVSSSNYSDAWPEPPEDFAGSRRAWLGVCIQRAVGVPVVGIGDVHTPEKARYLVENGYLELVALGRDHLCDTSWGNKALGIDNTPIRACLNCRRCVRYRNMDDCPLEKAAK